MKTAKPLSSDLSSSRRAQPVRQTRTNPPRYSGTLVRSFGTREFLSGGQGNGQSPDQQTDIFPAITYFADVITALPKELARHFTLLKEVDAKIFAPEEALGQLVDAALNAPLPPRRRQPKPPHIAETVSAQSGVPVIVNGIIINSQVATADTLDPYTRADPAWDPGNVPRRQLFRQCTYTMQEMLISLDEKNHVLSTAAEALNKQLSRLDNCFSYVEGEISEDTRYGNEKHWAYTESRTSKPSDRPRRDASSANHFPNSHQVSVDEAAARSELRKQTLLAKKSRTHLSEFDFDDHLDVRHKGDSGKKTHGNSKKSKPVESTATVGLGITNGTVVNGNPPSKRRKVEKGPLTGAAMERSLSTVFGNDGIALKGKTTSPGDTPVPDWSKKKLKGATTINGHTRKRAASNVNTKSPSWASSPTQSNFPEVKIATRVSPPPANGGRPTVTKARQNSIQSTTDSTRQPPSSTTSNKPNGNIAGPSDSDNVATVTVRNISTSNVKTSKDNSVSTNIELPAEDIEQQNTEMRRTVIVSSRKEGSLKHEDIEPNCDVPAQPPPTITTTVTLTKSGRASKPSTPALMSFPEPLRSRSSRNALEQTVTNKRSHKKGAGQAAQLAAQTAAAEDDTTSSIQDDEEDMEIDANEPRYCYCDGVSYGEMVACDADGCAKEWFHLDCVGLKVAPKGNAKWYCDDCKENMKNNKRLNGR